MQLAIKCLLFYANREIECLGKEKSMRRRGFLTLSVALAVVFITIMVGSSIWNVSIFRNAKADILRTECAMIERSLEMWSKSHRAIKEETIRYQEDGRVYYEKKRVYPTSLQELKDIDYVARGMDHSIFRYTTRDNCTGYHLEVDLPTGEIYVSQGSTF